LYPGTYAINSERARQQQKPGSAWIRRFFGGDTRLVKIKDNSPAKPSGKSGSGKARSSGKGRR